MMLLLLEEHVLLDGLSEIEEAKDHERHRSECCNKSGREPNVAILTVANIAIIDATENKTYQAEAEDEYGNDDKTKDAVRNNPEEADKVNQPLNDLVEPCDDNSNETKYSGIEQVGFVSKKIAGVRERGGHEDQEDHK